MRRAYCYLRLRLEAVMKHAGVVAFALGVSALCLGQFEAKAQGSLQGIPLQLGAPGSNPSKNPDVSQAHGSFRQTCKDIRMEGPLLVAICQKADVIGLVGGWRQTSLDATNCFSIDGISNENGQLDCSPGGSYKQTCRHIQTDRRQNAITAECRQQTRYAGTTGGKFVRSRLINASACRQGTIQNLDGILACDR
jgi:hypothetical protein